MTAETLIGEAGTVYLIHLDSPLGNDGNEGRNAAEHYLGWAQGGLAGLEARLDAHEEGRGSKLLAEANRRGIGWDVVRTWAGVDRHFERRLKRRGSARTICPACNPDALRNAR